MAIVQSSYDVFHDGMVEGQVLNTQTCDVDSLRNIGDDAIPFGRSVQRATAAGAGPRDIELGVKTNKFVGIAIQDERVPAADGMTFSKGEIVPVLWRGDVVVRVFTAVAAGADVVVATVQSSAKPPEFEGQFSSVAADSTHILIAGARFMTAAAVGGLAVVRLAGPLPVG